ncbi:hypothetical protein ACFLTP_05930 [Chloroflexota bacterium]
MIRVPERESFKFEEFLKELEEAGRRRNEVLHSFWERGGTGKAVTLKLAKKGVDLIAKPVDYDINEFNKVVEFIAQVGLKVFNFYMSFYRAKP